MKKITSFFLILGILFIEMFSHVVNVKAGADNLAPILMNAEITKNTVTVGDNIPVTLKVKEEGSGLKTVRVQMNSNTPNQKMISIQKDFETVKYSNGANYINIKLDLPTDSDTINADWCMAYIEFYDAKGNFSRYDGNWDDHNLISEGFGNVTNTVKSKNAHVKTIGSKADGKEPKLNWIKVVTPSVEHNGELKVKMNISEESGLSSVQLNLSKGSRLISLTPENAISEHKGTYTYTFTFKLKKECSPGEWDIQDIYLRDTKDNLGHYTNQLVEGKFVNYYNTNEQLDNHKVIILGDVADEIAPKVNDIKILNIDRKVEKPGLLKFQLDITEQHSGVRDFIVEIEHIDGDNIDIGSRAMYQFVCKKYENEAEAQSSSTPRFFYNNLLFSGKYNFSIPVSSMSDSGEYVIKVREMNDLQSNQYWGNNYGENPEVSFIVEDEFDYAFETGITNKHLIDKIKAMKDGETARVLLSKNKNENILKKDMFRAIAGKDKNIVCYMGGYQWIFRGKDISLNKVKDINLSVDIYLIDKTNMSTNQTAVCVAFKNNGELPGKAQFRFKTAFVKGYLEKANSLHWYHVNDGVNDKRIDYSKAGYKEVANKECNLDVVLDGDDSWCYVDVSHNSKYVLSHAKIGKTSFKNIKISGLKASYEYTGKKILPKIKVKLFGKNLKKGTDYKVICSSNVKIGTAKITIKGIGKYSKYGSITRKFKIVKGKQAIKLSDTKKVIRRATVKNTSYKFTLKVKNAKGKVTFKSADKKYVSVNKNGDITIKKGTPKGKYYVEVNVSGNKQYKKYTKKIMITVK